MCVCVFLKFNVNLLFIAYIGNEAHVGSCGGERLPVVSIAYSVVLLKNVRGERAYIFEREEASM